MRRDTGWIWPWPAMQKGDAQALLKSHRADHRTRISPRREANTERLGLGNDVGFCRNGPFGWRTGAATAVADAVEPR